MVNEWEDPTLKKWLSEFKNSTAQTYTYGLRHFKKAVGVKDLGGYVESTNVEQAFEDFKKFCETLKDRPPKTINTYTGAVRVFLADHGMELNRNDVRKLKRRGKLPKRSMASTRDKIPTKAQVRSLLNYSTAQGRALVMFLASTGCRIGETLQLNMTELDLVADPPFAEIRAETTKGGIGGRRVYLSYEARDAIKDWLRARVGLTKKNGGSYDRPEVFPITTSTARAMWNNACDKAELDDRDSVTGRRKYHLHSLRKFFRTNIGLNEDFTHALMGHVGYLDDAYHRPDQDKIAEAYKANIDRVSFYGLENQELLRDVRITQQKMEDRIQAMNEHLKRFTGMDFDEARRMMDWWVTYKDYVLQVEEAEAQDLDWRKLQRGELKLREPLKQRVVPEDKLEHWLNLGWEFVSSLNNGTGKCVIERKALM